MSLTTDYVDDKMLNSLCCDGRGLIQTFIYSVDNLPQILFDLVGNQTIQITNIQKHLRKKTL